MTLRNIFLQSPAFPFENNIFYQRNLPRASTFETLYLSLREKENRVYPDEIVKRLPEVPLHHPLKSEWRARKFSSQHLIDYLFRKKGHPKILELGCGNGWLCNHLARLPGSEVIGIDVNETELIQGSKIFGEGKNLTLVYADILTAPLPYRHFDYVILSASIQYFSDVRPLLHKLMDLLTEGGEIHILDSPIYHEKDVPSARNRSEKYFAAIGFPLMTQHYHHHTWKTFEGFQAKVLYDPDSFLNRMGRKFSLASPFPWIKIMARR